MDTSSVFRFFNIANGGQQDASQQAPRQNHDPRRAGSISADSSGGSGPNDNPPSASQANAARKQGKLSPEERRALRQQIDEAGNDIYKRKR